MYADRIKTVGGVAAVARKREGWDERRADYNSLEGLKRQPGLTEVVDDDFGRVYVSVPSANLTPKQARLLAHRLVVLAGDAEAKTKAQVKP